MRRDVQEFLANAVARCLNRCMLALLPSDRRAWGHALVAEQHEITNGRERLTWAAGGILMSVNELIRTLFSDRPTWVAGLAVWNRIGSCRFAQFNAVAIHRLAMRVRADPRVLAAQMGMALDLSPRIELARSGTRYEQLGTILCRSLRRLLWAGSLNGRHAGWAGAAPRLKVVPAQASRPLIRQPEDLARGHVRGRSGQLVKHPDYAQ